MRIPCRIPLASKSGHRTLHVTTSSLTRSTPHPVSTKYPKTSTSTIPKPLPYKSPVGAHTQKPATAIEQPTDTAISSNTPSNTEQPSLSSTNASASSLPTSSPRQGSIEAGRRATEEVIRTGKLPEKYKGASRRITAVLVALPILIVCGYELFQRVVVGKEPKTAHPISHPPKQSTSESDSDQPVASI